MRTNFKPRITRVTIFFILLIAVVFASIRGIGLADIEEAINNASIICLSCIGIG